MSTHTGHCLCGSVRYTAQNLDAHYHACHCAMCQRWNGGPILVIAAEAVKFDHTPHLGRYRSSEWAERGFCTQCGSSVFYVLVESGRYFLAAGTLDDTAGLSLSLEVFVDQKMPGYEFAGEHERWSAAQTMAHFAAASA